MEPIYAQIRTYCADVVSGVLEKVARNHNMSFEDLRSEFVLPLLDGSVVTVVPDLVREPGMCEARAVRGMCKRKALSGSCFCKLHGRAACGEPFFKTTKQEVLANEPLAEEADAPVENLHDLIPEEEPTTFVLPKIREHSMTTRSENRKKMRI